MATVVIEYCARCKWHNRAIWYVTELLQTFGDPSKETLAEVAVRPLFEESGVFRVKVRSLHGEQIIYSRRKKKTTDAQNQPYHYDGFPDSKLLKILVRNALFPETGLGHTDGKGDLLTECTDCAAQS